MNQSSTTDVVYPLTVTFTQIGPDRVEGPGRIRVTSPDWPDTTGEGDDSAEALRNLMAHISDQLPPSPAVRSAMIDAGYGPDVVEAWATHIKGFRLTRLRNLPDEAVDWLRAYVKEGIDAVYACRYMSVGLSPAAAGDVHAAGHTPESVAPYIGELGDFYVEHYGDCITTLWSEGEEELVEWILSEFDLDVAVKFAALYMDVHDARDWEPVIHKHHLNDDDLRAVRNLGWSIAEVDEAAETYRDSGISIGDAARSLFALERSANAFTGEAPF